MTMDEAVAVSKRIKEERALQDTFVTEVGLGSWEEALATLPQFTAHLELYCNRGSSKNKELAFKVKCNRLSVEIMCINIIYVYNRNSVMNQGCVKIVTRSKELAIMLKIF